MARARLLAVVEVHPGELVQPWRDQPRDACESPGRHRRRRSAPSVGLAAAQAPSFNHQPHEEVRAHSEQALGSERWEEADVHRCRDEGDGDRRREPPHLDRPLHRPEQPGEQRRHTGLRPMQAHAHEPRSSRRQPRDDAGCVAQPQAGRKNVIPATVTMMTRSSEYAGANHSGSAISGRIRGRTRSRHPRRRAVRPRCCTATTTRGRRFSAGSRTRPASAAGR
jgi:hypothetical protein